MDDMKSRTEMFLKKTETTVTLIPVEVVDRFPGEDKPTGARWKYKVTIKRKDHGQYTTPFYSSVYNYEKKKHATAYDVLACLEKHADYRDVWEFAQEFGISISSKEEYDRATKSFRGCKKEAKAMERLFGDAMDELEEIW